MGRKGICNWFYIFHRCSHSAVFPWIGPPFLRWRYYQHMNWHSEHSKSPEPTMVFLLAWPKHFDTVPPVWYHRTWWVLYTTVPMWLGESWVTNRSWLWIRVKSRIIGKRLFESSDLTKLQPSTFLWLQLHMALLSWLNCFRASYIIIDY